MSARGTGENVNRAEVAHIMGISVVTMDAWIRKGCPFRQKGSPGRPWVFNTADVRVWRGTYVAESIIDGQRAKDSGKCAGNAEDHKTRLIKARADIAEMEAAQLDESLVSVADVEKTWVDIMSLVRQRALGIAPKAAPLCAVETDTEACHVIIETFIHEALAELAATPVESAEAHDQNSKDNA